MSDRHHSNANGRHDPVDLPAGELAAWWDRRTGRRRVGSIDTEPQVDTEASGTTSTAVAGLEALSRADDLSAPWPGFLDQLERHLMDAPIAVLPPAKPSPVREAAPLVLTPPSARRGRGLIDILTVAAVVALLLSGSWSVLNDRATAPPPDGPNGVAGVSTPLTDPVSTPAAGVVALDQPWAVNLPDAAINGVPPVNTTECVTPSRPAGSVEAAIGERVALGDAAPTIEPVFVLDAGIDPARYPPASDTEVAAVTTLFQQLSACRFETGERVGTTLQPYTGAYWNLLSADAFNFDPVLFEGRTAEEVVREHYFFTATWVLEWSYPASVLDVRRVPADGQGRARLLVTTTGSEATEFEAVSLLVEDEGQWQFLARNLLSPEPPLPLSAQVADIVLGRDAYGPRGTGNFSSQLEADYPVSMTVANVGQTPHQLSIDGQDLGVVEPGASVVVQPFVVSPEVVSGAGGRLTFTVESVDLGATADAPEPRPLTIAVYPPGTLEFGQIARAARTPVAEPSIAATPGVTATPESTEPIQNPVAVAVAPELDRVVALDQPWAVSTGTQTFRGVAPRSTTDCVTEPRASGALIELVESASARPVAELPEYLIDGDLASLTSRYPVAAPDDTGIAQGFLDQWSACRYATGSSDVPLEDRYTGPAWSLLSNDFLLRDIPEGEGRTAESLVRQYRALSDVPRRNAYPDQVVEVRSYPADAAGQPRLLVVHQDLSPIGWLQVSLIVREGETWRLAEYTSTLGVPASSTPMADGSDPVGLVQIEVDVSDPADTVLQGQVFVSIPVAMTLHNGGSVPVPARIGDQDLGTLNPGQTVRIIPFVVTAAADTKTGETAEVTITTTNDLGREVVTTWPVSPSI